MLWLFGIAWAIAAKWLPWFVDKENDNVLDPLKELGIKK